MKEAFSTFPQESKKLDTNAFGVGGIVPVFSFLCTSCRGVELLGNSALLAANVSAVRELPKAVGRRPNGRSHARACYTLPWPGGRDLSSIARSSSILSVFRRSLSSQSAIRLLSHVSRLVASLKDNQLTLSCSSDKSSS